jgi:voltage-gated potassium channel
VARPDIVERWISRFLRQPLSVRNAARVIVTATAAVVIFGGVLMRLIDPSEYGNVWVGMWWSLQTVTTVGYGDVTPRNPSGRIVAAVVMLEGIAFLAIITAAITSIFVTRASRELEAARAEETRDTSNLDARLDELSAKLDRIEQALGQRDGQA